jgi:transposase
MFGCSLHWRSFEVLVPITLCCISVSRFFRTFRGAGWRLLRYNKKLKFLIACLEWIVSVHLLNVLLPGPTRLRLTTLTTTDERISLDLIATQTAASCPTGVSESTRIHSYYQRTVADLPWASRPVQLHLHVRRFMCDNAACPRVTFAEPLPEVVARSARRTTRLADEQRHLALDVGGQMGARIAQRQGMPVSPDTLLRLARRAILPSRPTPTALGVDEWAYRKGQDYKTILVDLDTHRPIDLLPEYTAAAFAAWLQAHPGVDIIARDRAGTFADGAAQGAPAAVQVADRFHLMKNLREALEPILDRLSEARQAAADMLADAAPATAPRQTPSVVETTASSPTVSFAPRPLPASGIPRPPYLERVAHQLRAKRKQRYDQVVALRQAGKGVRTIARDLGMNRQTVRRFVLASAFPERAPRPAVPSKLDPYTPYLEERWNVGETNGRQLWHEIQAQGFSGSLALVVRWARRQRMLAPPPPAPLGPRIGRPPVQRAAPRRPAPLATRQVVWWLLRPPEALKPSIQALLEEMEQVSPAFGPLYRLAHTFTQMIRARQAESLDTWLEQASASGFPELVSLATGIKRDYAAVKAALRLPYSTGPVEGNINRLKLIKRSMYGRANFDLLRQRVLAG